MKKEKRIPLQKPAEILIAEDSITQSTQLAHLLESNLYKVSIAQNGKQAMDSLSKHRPSLVITDILMPEMNGYELCKKIKSNKDTEDIPVILLTRLSDPEEIIEGLSCGADSFITKPYNEKHLLSNIRKILSIENGLDYQKVPFGVQILFNGEKRTIQAEQQNVIKLMLDIYEGAIYQNEKLVQTQEELRLLNERLESMVEDRTSDLKEEIKLSNKITERLKEGEEKYRSLFENSTVGIYRTTPDGKILLANAALVKMLGFSSFEALANRNLEEEGFEPSYERSHFKDIMENEGYVHGMEAAWRRTDGTILFVSESTRSITGKNGKILYYDGIVEDISVRKKAEAFRKETEERYSTLFNNMLNGYAYCKMLYDGDYPYDFIYLEVNKAFESLTGLKNVKGKNVNDIIPGIRESDSELFEIYSRVALTGKPEVFENYVDSLKMWFSVSVYSPEKEYFVAIFDVITDRKLAEERIRDIAKFPSENPDPVLRLDKDGILLYANEACYKLLTWKLRPGSKVPEVLLRAVMKVLGTGHQGKVDEEHNHLLFSFDIVPVMEAGYVNIYGHDITERRLAEESLRESEERFRYMANSVPQLVWVARANGFIYWYNQRWYDYTGTNPEQMEGWGWQMVHDPVVLPKVMKEWTESIASGQAFEMNFPLRRGDGQFRTFLTRVEPWKDSEGKVLQWFGTNTDVEIMKQAENEIRSLNIELDNRVNERTAKLEAANKELEAFSYSVSHDLRAPLRAVHGYTKILMEEYKNTLDDEGKRICDVISSSATKMGELIDDLLSFSRIGRSDLNPSVIDMNKLVVMNFDGITSPTERERIKFKVSKLQKSYGDVKLISQVWINLISNAIKYSSKNKVSEILIGSSVSEKMVTYYIKDNGVGFDMQYSHKLFGVFQRLHSESEFEGNGVGLAIVQRIILKHGGKVWAEGEVDKGATFYFSLPINEEDEKEKVKRRK